MMRSNPRRHDGLLRAVNLNDIEVQEIQAAASQVFPDVVINISGSTVGCPCEDGPKCTGEVWLMASTSSGPKDLKLSKIDNRWSVGPVQQWWLKYNKFEAAYPYNQRDFDYYSAESDLKSDFPECLTDPVSRP
jgi:hypothetical protein